MPLIFEWNAQKAGSNFQKHRVSFDEASTVFDDPLAVIFPDDDHSLEEAREIIIGHSIMRRLVIVCFTERYALQSAPRIEFAFSVRARRHASNGKTMKSIPKTKSHRKERSDSSRLEYRFDYT